MSPAERFSSMLMRRILFATLAISDLVKEGENTLEITVYNNWRNRLIADESLPEAERKTWTNYQPFSAGDDLQSSGLLGPVTLYML